MQISTGIIRLSHTVAQKRRPLLLTARVFKTSESSCTIWHSSTLFFWTIHWVTTLTFFSIFWILIRSGVPPPSESQQPRLRFGAWATNTLRKFQCKTRSRTSRTGCPQKIYSNGKIESPRTVFWNKRRACYCEASREKSRGFECVLLLLLLENGERMQHPFARNNGICVIDFFLQRVGQNENRREKDVSDERKTMTLI